MVDGRQPKRWRLAKVHLGYAHHRLAQSPRLEHATEAGVLSLMEQYAHNLERDRLKDTLETLAALGELHSCRGAYWRDLQRAAEYMELPERARELRARLHVALAATVGRQDG